MLAKKKSDDKIPVESELPHEPPSPSDGGTSESSQGTDVMAIEDAIGIKDRSKGSQKVLEKVGELVSNMHILLVKKALKQLSMPVDMPTNLIMKGALLSRGVGTGTCIYDMPFVTIEADEIQIESAKVQIETSLNSPLPRFICALFQHLTTPDEHNA